MTLSRFFRRLLAFFPTKLPSGLQEFDMWAEDIIDLYQAPNNDSVKFTLAVMVLHLDSTTAYKPKEYFGRSLFKGMANQVVSQIIQDLKTKQQDEAKLKETLNETAH